jgi:D-3-phosphoglycerate dehydrogenase
MGSELSGKTLGLIGCGNIGSIVADRAQGLKMKVVVYDPYLSEDHANNLNIEKIELDDLLARADFISLHTPLNDSTRGIIDAKAIEKMKPTARIINCARGGLVNEEDLRKALDEGKIAGAAFDVFSEEPAKENVLFGSDKLVATPHLGASTSEAQENVALQVAEQISDYLTVGTVTNALNIPSVSAEDAQKLKPYLELVEKLGGFVGQMTETGIKGIKIEYEGGAAELNTKPLTSVALKGVLSPLITEVNMVNAPVIAKSREIEVAEIKHDRKGDYQTMIRITLQTEKRERSIAGTLFGNQPRLLEMHGVKLEAGLGKYMLYVNNEDKPGLIGDLGKLLGDEKVNIANFHLGRNDDQSDAVALLELDQEVSADALDRINTLASVKQAKLIKF